MKKLFLSLLIISSFLAAPVSAATKAVPVKTKAVPAKSKTVPVQAKPAWSPFLPEGFILLSLGPRRQGSLLFLKPRTIMVQLIL